MEGVEGKGVEGVEGGRWGVRGRGSGDGRGKAGRGGCFDWLVGVRLVPYEREVAEVVCMRETGELSVRLFNQRVHTPGPEEERHCSRLSEGARNAVSWVRRNGGVGDCCGRRRL